MSVKAARHLAAIVVGATIGIVIAIGIPVWLARLILCIIFATPLAIAAAWFDTGREEMGEIISMTLPRKKKP